VSVGRHPTRPADLRTANCPGAHGRWLSRPISDRLAAVPVAQSCQIAAAMASSRWATLEANALL
jgi:hypothetical protein